MRFRLHPLCILSLAAILVPGSGLPARQHDHPQATSEMSSRAQSRPSRAITQEELHRNGGVPPGWKFTLPAGEALRGRRLFAEFECYKCHTVAGEDFPSSGSGPENAGPALTGMGPHHPAEYFAESILDPNAVILEGPGYVGPDGRSIMPAYTDSLSVAQLVDLVAYLKSLSAGGTHGGDAHHHPASR